MLIAISLSAQSIDLDSIEVKANHKNLREHFHKIQKIKDSVKSQSIGISLTEILREQTPIFFKESGAGMVSSVSFRGTTAQQTAVLWNGLNINSQLLGQTDFNAVSWATADDLQVEYGSGGIMNGSGAIGGTVSLSNRPKFGKKNTQKLSLGYGSYQHLLLDYSHLMANENSYFEVKYSREQSKNDYKISSKNYENLNADFWKNDMGVNFGFLFNNQHKILFFNEFYNDKRNFSLIISTENKSRYFNYNQRHLLRYEFQQKKLKITPEIGFLKENYTYYPNIKKTENSGNGVGSLITNLQINLKPLKKIDLKWKNGWIYRESLPDENASMKQSFRREFQTSFNGFFKPYKNLQLELGARKEWVTHFESPFLYSSVINFQALKNFELKLKAASSFRAPSFNDLYFEPGGNTDLKPEYSKSYELSSGIDFRYLKLGFNLFHQNIRDMIRWMPADKGYWKAFNVDRVRIKGLEANAEAEFNLFKIKTKAKMFFSYTDAKEVKTKLSLMYVPPIQAGLNFVFQYQKFSLGWNNRYTDDVYFSLGKEENARVKEYLLSDVMLKYTFLNNKLDVAFRINNIYNKIYQTILNRYQPQRNFNIKINYELF
ncbi:Outer membrane cobalamin translocator [Candidatus Ornithobacterium hominis]|uniref:Outer membrane cobalamin translocator n=1 Tax=Candidatus Ornithobacterium hominis TaxID=2497989 RepID=A0A383U3A3_9FLAO|nr:Outer membrane cobalamin translocator [Candidatus Ornithobacterium hominis]